MSLFQRGGWLLAQVASPISGLTLGSFRATPTRIGCVPGRNQRYQSVAQTILTFLSPRVRDAVTPNSNFDNNLYVAMVSVKQSICCAMEAKPTSNTSLARSCSPPLLFAICRLGGVPIADNDASAFVNIVEVSAAGLPD
jgi:hypothetical protein